MPFTRPQHERDVVNKAARQIVRDEAADATKIDAALGVVGNWRSAHGHPLNTFQWWLRRHVGEVDSDALVAQRMKRLPSILRKLRDRPDMKLTQMQDIGGVRAVVKDVDLVYKLRDLYVKSDLRHERYHEDDYIQHPRESGYRGIHLCYKYRSDKVGGTFYNGLKVEVQLRSKLQHAWATAVETVDTLLSTALKASRGDPEWQRFFALMSSAMAHREGTPPVPGTPVDLKDLKKELRELAAKLKVQQRLTTFGAAISEVGTTSKNDHYILLKLNSESRTIEKRGFQSSQFSEATEAYLQAEKAIRTPQEEVVLVSVSNINALQDAYPNYYLDTQDFLAELDRVLKT